VLLDVMFEVPSSDIVKRVILPKGLIDEGLDPILLSEDQVRQAS